MSLGGVIIYPGFWRRLGALFVDGIVAGIPAAIITYIIFGEADHDRFADGLTMLYTLLLPVFWEGRTVGKKALGIRIETLDGMPPGIGRMLLRVVVGNLVYGITFGVALLISIIMVAAREDKRSVHDFIAGTRVVYE